MIVNPKAIIAKVAAKITDYFIIYFFLFSDFLAKYSDFISIVWVIFIGGFNLIEFG